MKVNPTASSNKALALAAQKLIDEKTKPLGSLGQLETLAIRLAVLQQSLTPSLDHARILVFAADHGIAAEEVSAYPSRVTAEMVRNFAAGGAAINVLSRISASDLEVIDVGVDADLSDLDAIRHAKIRSGTANFLYEPAMSTEECISAMEVGRDAVRRAAQEGMQVIGLGEMGIGNTTSSSAILSFLLQASVHQTVGRGTGIDDEQLDHKKEIVAAAIKRYADHDPTPLAALRLLGGLEIAAMVGAAMEAVHHRIAVVLDGFISSIAGMIAVKEQPESHQVIFFSHLSAECGHRLVFQEMQGVPLLDLGMRLGEGTGAALAIPILRAATAILCDMATFAEAGVSRQAQPQVIHLNR